MILAKFNGISSAAQSSKVTTPATRSGTKVSRTSASRRSAIHNSAAIAASAKTPAAMKACTTVLPASYISTAGPVASGSIASTAVTKLRSSLVSSGSPLGRTCTLARPSGVTHSLVRSSGMFWGVIS